jgi:hypothetical protein
MSAIDADRGILATPPTSRRYGSASGFIRREDHDPTLEQGTIPDVGGARLAEFTELLAAPIANTEAREALGRLADE